MKIGVAHMELSNTLGENMHVLHKALHYQFLK